MKILLEKLKYFLMFSLALLILSQCGGDDEPTIFDAQQASKKALDIVSGQVVSTVADSTGAIAEWDVIIMTPVGSTLKVEFAQATGDLLEIEGEVAPFDYEVNPGMGLIPFSQARQIALAEASGEIQEWILKVDAITGIWTYRLKIDVNGQVEDLRIDAATGAVLG